MHEEDKKFFTRIQSDLSEINKSLMNLSGMGRDLDITKENIKNLASLVVMSQNEIHELKNTNSETLNEIKSNLNEKFKTTREFELELGQFKQKSKTDENEIKSLNDTIEKLKQENSELKSTVKILTNLNTDSSNQVEGLKIKLEQAHEKTTNQLNEHLILVNRYNKLATRLKEKQDKYVKEVGEKNIEIEKIMKTCEEGSNSLAKCQEEKENLEVELAKSNENFGNKCEELTTSLKTNQELVQENEKLKKNCEEQSNSLAKSKEEFKNLQENLVDANSKKTIQSKERQKLENQMNILIDLMKIPEEKRNFHQLRQEIENLMSEHIKEKERADNLATLFQC